MKRKVPRLKSDEEAEAFLDQDLSDLDFSQFKPLNFEFEAKDGRMNIRLPTSLIEALKVAAETRGVPYQRFTREMIELGLAANAKRKLGAAS